MRARKGLRQRHLRRRSRGRCGPGHVRAGGGPPISVDPAQGGCLGNLAQTTFRWSLCSCSDLDVSAPLVTDAYDSTKGPYAPGQLGGGVGVDRDVTHWSQAVTVGGTLWEAGGHAYQSSGPASTIMGDMHPCGKLECELSFTVRKDAFVSCTLTGHHRRRDDKQDYEFQAPACDCSPQAMVFVSAIVAAHRPPNNDNAAIGLSASVSSRRPRGRSRSGPSVRKLLSHEDHHGHPADDCGAWADCALHRRNRQPERSDRFVLDPTAELDRSRRRYHQVIANRRYRITQLSSAQSDVRDGGTDILSFSQNVRIGGEFRAAASTLVDWSANNQGLYGSRSSRALQIESDDDDPLRSRRPRRRNIVSRSGRSRCSPTADPPSAAVASIQRHARVAKRLLKSGLQPGSMWSMRERRRLLRSLVCDERDRASQMSS